MLDSKVIDLTDRLIQVQFAERRQQLHGELLNAAGQFSARGTLNSSMHLQRVTEICRHEIEIRAWLVYNAHVRVLSQLAVTPYPELSQDLKGRLAYFLPLGDDYAQAPKDLAQRIGLQSHPDIRVHETRDHVLAKIGTEIDIFVETLARQKQQQSAQPEGSSVYHFHSAVGAFQASSGSIANVVQHIGSHDKEAIQEALSAVKEALTTLSEFQDFPKREIVEIVDEASSEIAKPSPNRVKLTSMLTTIGDTIRMAGSLNSAYQLLKTAILPLGITLP
jgi:hypothetical protein